MIGRPTNGGSERAAAEVLHRLAKTLKEDAEWMLSALDKDLDEIASLLRSDAEWVLQALDLHAPEWEAQLGPRSRRMFRMMVLFSVLGNRDRDMLLALAARLAQGKATAAELTSNRPVTKRPPSRANVSVSSMGAPRVLLVDDDPDALRVTRAMLRKSGFDVTVATGGDEALALMDADAPFDIVVTDYAMPGLNGLGLIELAQEREPGLPGLVVTGYGNDIDAKRLPACVEVLPKPFTRSKFVERIRDLTQAHAGAATSEMPVSEFDGS